MGCALPVHKEGLQAGAVRVVHGLHKTQVDQDRESDDSRNCEGDDRTQAAIVHKVHHTTITRLRDREHRIGEPTTWARGSCWTRRRST
jgi:hypothetical protein